MAANPTAKQGLSIGSGGELSLAHILLRGFPGLPSFEDGGIVDTCLQADAHYVFEYLCMYSMSSVVLLVSVISLTLQLPVILPLSFLQVSAVQKWDLTEQREIQYR